MNTLHIDLSDLEKGIYFISLSGLGTLHQKRIIKG